MSTYASDALYKKVETALNDKSNYNLYKNTIDQHMANNFDKYSAIGPIKRPIFRTEESDLMFQSMGLTKDDLTGTINLLKSKDSRWKIRGVDQPVNLAVVLSLRYFLVKNDEKQIKNALSYMICFNYPLFHYKYFRKAEPTESIMSYTINNLSNKYQIKKAVEDMYNVSVVSVNTILVKGKTKSRYTKAGLITGKTSDYKKAVVVLKEGDKIDFFSNI